MRKIIHIDMDAFYASVAQRDDPSLRGKPVVVAWRGNRSVVCAASYEARSYGIRSAMSAVRAERLCPEAIFVPPQFPRYQEIAQQVREIMLSYTDQIEPLSLDEAYLDVTQTKIALPSATTIAQAIRKQIYAATSLTASAGVAPNKFLAKIASEWRKPNGIFVIRPHQAESFLHPLPVACVPGIGKIMEGKLKALNVMTIGELRAIPMHVLEHHFGRYGVRLHELSQGIDHSDVTPDRPTQSISAEDTFEQDVLLPEVEPRIRYLAEKVWAATKKTERTGRTVVLKLKTSAFRLLTRSYTPATPPSTAEELIQFAVTLLSRVSLPPQTRYRLVGVGLGHFCEPSSATPQLELFSS